MTERADHTVRRTAVGGAVLLVALVLVKNVGDYEGGDAVVVLLPLAAVLGACGGALVGLLLRHLLRTEPP